MHDARAKMLRLLGLARRAGRLVWGSAACEQALRKGRPQLLLIAADAADGTRKRFIGLCERSSVAYSLRLTASELEQVCGRSPLVLVALTDASFAAELMRLDEIVGRAPEPLAVET